MDAPGFDNDSGFGLIQADAALAALLAHGVVTGAGFGGGPHVRVFDGATGLRSRVRPAASSRSPPPSPAESASRRTTSTVTAGPTSSPALVRAAARTSAVFDGATGAQLPGPMGSFLAFDAQFTGGVFVAAGRCDGRRPRIIVGADRGGGPHVKVFDARRRGPRCSASSPTPRGSRAASGSRPATSTATGVDDIITGAGPGGGPHVQVFSGRTLTVFRELLRVQPRLHRAASTSRLAT